MRRHMNSTTHLQTKANWSGSQQKRHSETDQKSWNYGYERW
jgi:hypothetical protein